eukprot:g39785.t1
MYVHDYEEWEQFFQFWKVLWKNDEVWIRQLSFPFFEIREFCWGTKVTHPNSAVGPVPPINKEKSRNFVDSSHPIKSVARIFSLGFILEFLD